MSELSEEEIERFYPSSDGEPMVETDAHRRVMLDLLHILEEFFADQPEVYVSGNSNIYWWAGGRLIGLSPDVYVVFGVPKAVKRNSYHLERERIFPHVVFEVTSPSTAMQDREGKQTLFQTDFKVEEYYRFDPRMGISGPRLWGCGERREAMSRSQR